MNRRTEVPSIPDPTPDGLVELARSIKNLLDVREGRAGDKQDRFVSFRDLEEMKLITDAKTKSGNPADDGGNPNPNPGGYNPEEDYTTPPQPTGFRVSGGYGVIMLDWDTPQAQYKNHAYTEIWRNTVDALGNAVMIGTTIASVYTDPVPASATYYYWIRFVSQANVTGPYNSTSGTPGTSAIDVVAVLNALSSEITGSQLYNDLGTRIVDLESQSSEYASLLNEVRSDLTNTRAALSDAMSSSGSAIITAQTTSATQAKQITALGTRVGSAESTIVNLQSTTATQATALTSLTTRVGTAESNITNLQTTTATQATSISQLSSAVNGNTASIQTLQTVSNGLSAQYTVKIDNNGHISGFGLASTVVNGTPTSAFIVRADKFAIVGPNDTTNGLGTTTPSSTTVPFIVVPAGGTTQDGVTYPAGTYIRAAYIADATITAAKIADATITAAEIADATITTAEIAEGTITTANIAETIKSSNWDLSGGTLGWQINKSGTATFNQVNVRGTVYATSGSFGNPSGYHIVVGGASIYSSNYVPGSTGFTINYLGQAEFNNVTVRGTVFATSGSFTGAVTATSGSFTGSLNAASGTFSGTLTADAINAVNTINIAGNAVTIPQYTSQSGSVYVGNWVENGYEQWYNSADDVYVGDFQPDPNQNDYNPPVSTISWTSTSTTYWSDIMSFTVDYGNVANSPDSILGFTQRCTIPSGGVWGIRWRVVRSSGTFTVIGYGSYPLFNNSVATGSFSGIAFDPNPPQGSNTYKLQVALFGDINNGVYFLGGKFFALGAKR